jgi:glycosyltransferase involved in cell wall biosynthesis
MRVLVLSSLYPNVTQPNFGVFIENRARRLAAYAPGVAQGLQVAVMAPIPVPIWPLSHHPRTRRLLEVPDREERYGLTVYHPRFSYVPAFGWRWTPRAMAHAVLGALKPLQAAGYKPDVIDAHYFYPDGVAAMRVAQVLGVPFMCTARGSDITYWPQLPAARRAILEVGANAQALAAVSASLHDEMVALGMGASKTHVLRNGVDLEHFGPRNREAARARFGVSGPVLLSVGALIPRKAHDITLKALAKIPDATLLIAGEGPERGRLQALAGALGLGERVRLLGSVAHQDLPELYAAADISILASKREGLANVLLEAIACGAPIIATNVDGAAEVLDDPACGRLIPVGDVVALQAAIETLRANPPDRAAVRRSAMRFSWDKTTSAQYELLKSLLTS